MKKTLFVFALSASMLAFGSCQSTQEERAEDRVEEVEDDMEDTAEEVEDDVEETTERRTTN